MKRQIHLLGATGSIGEQTLDVIRSHPEHFELVSMAFGSNLDKGAAAAEEFRPSLIACFDEPTAQELRQRLRYKPEITVGSDGLHACAEAGKPGDVLVNAVMGSVGLGPTLKAIEKGIDIAIANKETLVTAGHLVMAAQKKTGVRLAPVDSEHSAIAQCLHGEKKDVSKLILTASGGSFRDRTRKELEGVKVEEALNHPNWSMGAKITIDSATMMNKGLEVIEAHWLFDQPYDNIDVILHKESIIHSMVEYVDGSVLAHLGTPDMRVPIQYALTEPSRLAVSGSERLKLWEVGALHFQPMDYERFRALQLAIDAGRTGGSATAVLNAANEQAVALFLDNKMTFLDIDRVVERALERHNVISEPSLEDIQSVDQEIREEIIRTYA
ncbi:1-deoxy-D-xylulose-5-phosphate reductoisomerase [Alkalicoccus chagannorensis]|uniref:1-deoxy-D-xylulose-5-phosphate reductoisomerase n=1 Tax=Alkalicoccus chagannorensis TaxID=427072 RepID=UPI00040269C5|nr:1-deoxy-D-xylulose-5-phosphate reductoisomerase [Alkalicoccus chagannorensis]